MVLTNIYGGAVLGTALGGKTRSRKMATDKTDFKDVNRGKFHVVNPRTGKAMALNSSKEDAKKKARKMTRDENKPFVVVQTVGMVVPEKQK